MLHEKFWKLITEGQFDAQRIVLAMFMKCYEKGYSFKDSIDLMERTIRNAEKDMEGEAK